MKKMNQLNNQYQELEKQRKDKIRSEPNKFKRFFKWCWHWFTFPWIWAWMNLRDWKTWIIFLVVLAVYSSSVWGFYVGALFCGWDTTEAGKWCIGIGTAVWTWWLSPVGSPFIILCITTTIGVKALFDKINDIKQRRRSKLNE